MKKYIYTYVFVTFCSFLVIFLFFISETHEIILKCNDNIKPKNNEVVVVDKENFNSQQLQNDTITNKNADDITNFNCENHIDIEKLLKTNTISKSSSNLEKCQLRQLLRDKQTNIIKKKENENVTSKPGTFYHKKIYSNRTNFRQYIKQCTSVHNLHTNTMYNKSKAILKWKKILEINFLNVSNVKFNMNDAEDNDESNYEFYILTEDRGIIIPNDQNEIGIDEIKDAFLTLHDVNIKLLPKNWVEHHFEMILFKLLLYEKQYEFLFINSICEPKNILTQLKYRYDKEILYKENSCLKRILLNIDKPSRCMVLIVLHIIKKKNSENENEDDIELILSDQWYYICTCIDLPMKKLINQGRIRIGSKIIVQNAKLINFRKNYNYDLTSLPDNIYLKIHTNTTSPSKSNIKLGFLKNFKYLLDKRIDNIFVDGGEIPYLKVFIARRYKPYFVYGNELDNRIFFSENERKRYEEEHLIENLLKLFDKQPLTVDDSMNILNSIGIKENGEKIKNCINSGSSLFGYVV